MLGEWTEPDILGGLAVLLGGVVAAASPCGSDADPAGGPVEAAGEAGGFDEGLDEDGGGGVAAGPVAGQTAADECEDVGSEVGDADPGQDEEPEVVDDQRQVLPAQGRGPSDEAVAWCERPCGGAEAEHGERPAVAVVDGVAHLGADEGLVAEIVVAGDELVPQPALGGADGADLQRADLVEGRGRWEAGRGLGSDLVFCFMQDL